MIRLVLLLIALVVGFGGGVYWAHHNPDAAAKLAAEERRRLIQVQLELNRRLKEKVAALDSKTAAPKSGVASLVPSGQAAVAKEDVGALKADVEKQEQELLKELEKVSGK